MNKGTLIWLLFYFKFARSGIILKRNFDRCIFQNKKKKYLKQLEINNFMLANKDNRNPLHQIVKIRKLI